MRLYIMLLFYFLVSIVFCCAQSAFHVVPLGVKGGIQEGNLSAYLIAPSASDKYLCFDAGSLNSGIQKAVDNRIFSVSPDSVLKSYIKGYFISHAHLDHTAGLMINSTDDIPKKIYSFPKCLEIIKDHYFNWESWPNFGNEGAGLALKKYTYQPLEEGRETSADQTEMHVTALRLSHSNPYESAAFLIRHDSSYVLYFGDTGADEIERTDKMHKVWKVISPLIRGGKLKGIFLEVSYPDQQPDTKLYGHLTPKWFFKEMEKLSHLTGREKLNNLSVIITHLKPGNGNEETIRTQLETLNSLHLRLIIPRQGVRLEL